MVTHREPSRQSIYYSGSYRHLTVSVFSLPISSPIANQDSASSSVPGLGYRLEHTTRQRRTTPRDDPEPGAGCRMGANSFAGARIEYDIHFFPIEVSLDIPFWEVAAVIERDDELDKWNHWHRKWGLSWSAKGNLDEIVKWLWAGTVRPNGNDDIHRSWEKDLTGPWVTGSPESGPEELRPLAYVNPQITPHIKIGEEVSADIG